MRRFYKMCETYTLLYIDNFQKLQKKFKISFKKVWIGKIDKEYSINLIRSKIAVHSLSNKYVILSITIITLFI